MPTFTERYDEALAKERQREVKDLIDNGCQFHTGCKCVRCVIEDSDEPGVHLAFEETQSIMLELDDEDDSHGIPCHRHGCKRVIEPYYEPVFVVGIYVNDEKKAQEFWCKQCAVKGMKGELS